MTPRPDKLKYSSLMDVGEVVVGCTDMLGRSFMITNEGQVFEMTLDHAGQMTLSSCPLIIEIHE
jgi:hypothetical protein